MCRDPIMRLKNYRILESMAILQGKGKSGPLSFCLKSSPLPQLIHRPEVPFWKGKAKKTTCYHSPLPPVPTHRECHSTLLNPQVQCSGTRVLTREKAAINVQTIWVCLKGLK